MSDLISYLQKNHAQISYFQAVSILCEFYKTKYKDADPLTSGRIQLWPHIAFTFPGSDIASISSENGGESVLMSLSFMGLLGISSPLPNYFTEYCLAHADDGEALSDFLTIFNHRLYALFYQSWQKYTAILRTFNGELFDIFEKIALLGSIRKDPAAPDDWQKMIAYVGLFCGSSRSAEGLKVIVSDYFDDIPVAITQWIGCWTEVDNLPMIGKDSILGINAIIGTHIYDRSGKFRIILGPLDKEIFGTFLHDSPNIKRLKQITNQYLSDALTFDIEVRLKPTALVPVILGADTAQLGIFSSCGPSRGTCDTYSILIE